MEAFGIILIIILGLLFNPLIWLGILIAIVIYRKRKSGSISSLMVSKQVRDAQAAATQVATAPVVSHHQTQRLLEEIARNTTDAVERDTLERAAYSIQHNLHYLVSRAAFRKQAGAAVSETVAVPQSQEPAQAPPTTASEPLAERGIKALQNINILLYLGAFFVVVAAGIFVGSTYQSITPGGQVFILALLAGSFYLGGLGLYRFTDKIKPAGVTFTAIGLLLGPLVGVAAQSLLFVGKNPGSLWLITTAILLTMQVVAFLLIKKTYIVWFAALTTISLFQSITATSNAALYWYGWVMLATGMAYAVLAHFTDDTQLREPLAVTAQIFVPLSVVFAVFGISQFGLWQVGIQLILTAIFYLVCSILQNFDADDEVQVYLTLAAVLFPAGVTLTLIERNLPHLGTVALLAIIASLYVVVEKFAIHDRHKPIFAILSTLLITLVPAFVINDGALLAWVLIGAAVFHAAHYYITRSGIAYTLFVTTVSVIPYAISERVLGTPLSTDYLAGVYVGLAAIGALATTYLLEKRRHPQLAALTRGFIGLWLLGSILVSLTGASTTWPSVLALIAGGILLFMALTGPRALIGATALSWNLAIIALGLRSDWSSTWIALGIILIALTIYGCKWLAQFKKDPAADIILVATVLGLLVGYLLGFSNQEAGLLVVMALPVIVAFGLSYIEDERLASGLAFVGLLGWSFRLARVTGLWISPTLLITALGLYAIGSLLTGERAKLARQIGVAGSFTPLLTNNANQLPAWLPVLQNYTAGGLTLAESFTTQNRLGKYAGSVVIWLATLQSFQALKLTETQIYMQTTAAYFGALAYRQWQGQKKQAQDILTATALGFATIPLAFQAISDASGAYVLSILALGIVILLIGISTHYTLVRTWGIATLIIITLYKTAGAILDLPAWLWFGGIGLTTLAGAIYLLSRRPHEPESK